MIRVLYYPTLQQGWLEREFADDIVPKILQSGVLKMVRLTEAEIPEMDACNCGQAVTNDGLHAKTCPAVTAEMVKPEEVVVAVFCGEYIMERVDE